MPNYLDPSYTYYLPYLINLIIDKVYYYSKGIIEELVLISNYSTYNTKIKSNII
jgi:hypothetical protein